MRCSGQSCDVDWCFDCGPRLGYWSQTIELNCGHDKVDMAAHVLGKSVFIARNAISAGFFVLEVVVFSVEKSFELSDGSCEFDPIAA